MKKFLSVLLAVMMVLSTVSFAVPSAVGTIDVAVEAPVVPEVAEDAALAAEISEDTDSYGTLILNLDFEDDTYPTDGSISNSGPVNSYTSAENEITLPKEFGSAYFRIGMPNAWSGEYNTTLNGTNVLPVSANTYPYFTMQAFKSSSDWNSNTVVLPTGYYTVVGDFAKDANNIGTGIIISRIGNSGGKTSGNTQNLTTEMQTYTHQLVLEESSTTEGQYQFRDSTPGATVNGPYTAISTIGTYFGTSTADNDIYYVDNYKMYWKPLTANVTLVSDADYLTLPEAFEVSTNGVLVSELVADVETVAFYQAVTGVKVNDVEYALTDTVYITEDSEVEVLSEEDTEYTAEWIDKRYGTLVFKSDFDSATVGSIDIMGDDNADLAAFTATSEMNPYYSEYSSMVGSMLLGSGAVSAAEIVSDETLGSNVLKITTNGSYPSITYTTPYGQRNKCDIVNSTTGVYTIVHKYKTDTGLNPTYRYNGWKNNNSTLTSNGGDASQTSMTSTDLGNGYTEWVATYNMTEDYNIDQFKLHLNGSSTGGYAYFDDIKVYWKPASVNVEIADCDVKGVTIANKSLTGVSTFGTVSDFLTLAGVDYSAVSNLSYIFRGVSVASNPSEVYGLDDTLYLFEDSTVNLVFEKVDMSDWTDENGIVLFEIDFNDAEAATVFTPQTENENYVLTTFGAKVNPNIAGSEKWVLSNSGMDIVGIQDGALKFQWDGTGKWPQILIGNSSNTDGNQLIGKNGTYYVHAEYKALDSVDSQMTGVNITANGFVDGVHKGPNGVLYIGAHTPTANEWFTIEGSKSTWDNDTDGLDNDDINKITTVFNHNATTNTVGGCYLMDNIKLCWRPATVDVTVEGGSNENFETVTLRDVPTDATVAEIIDMLPGTVDDYGQLTNLAKGSEKLGASAALNAVSDVTLTAIWSPWKVIEGAGQEFAISDAYYAKNQGVFSARGFGPVTHVGDGGTVTKAFITMYNGTASVNDGYGIYTTGGNLVYKQLTPNAGDSNVHGSATYTDNYTVAAVPQGARHRAIINVNLPANNAAKYAVIKYKFQNVPDLNSDFAKNLGATATADGKSATYTTREGNTDTYSNLVDYTAKYYVTQQNDVNHYGGGEEFEAGKKAAEAGDGVKVDLESIEDQWIYDLLPINATLNTEGVKSILIDRPNHFRDMITVWDYVMFVGEGDEEEIEVPEEPTPEYAPTTSDETSVRLQAPKGIRFKAGMTAEVDGLASDYGWVVGRAAKGATEETLVIGAANTVVAYGREAGVKIKEFFDETDEFKTFTAVVYNIPAGNEDDVICIKPFVIVEGETFYGEMMSKTPREVAQAHGVDVSEIMK